MKASGTFSVSMNPTDSAITSTQNASFANMAIEKSYSGDLLGKSRGEMLSVRTSQEGSAGYVALEHVEAELNNKRGTFVLQQCGLIIAVKIFYC